jgi:hypothetical protein
MRLIISQKTPYYYFVNPEITSIAFAVLAVFIVPSRLRKTLNLPFALKASKWSL